MPFDRMEGGDSLDFLLAHGLSAAEIERLTAEGVHMDELLAAGQRLVERGRTLSGGETLHSAGLDLFRPVSEFAEVEANWLVNGWIPAGQITLLAADGGVGKTSVTCDIAAAISAGGRCILDEPDTVREPQKVLFLTTEDSISQKLKKKLRLLHANQDNVIAPDPTLDTTGVLHALKFGSPLLAEAVRYYRPALCILDPVQGYVPSDVNMCSRNAMRDCLSTLTTLGEQTGCAFLVVCHSNKRRGASGRDRISDSADLWDIARAVIMAGYDGSQKGIRYLANEKNNYAGLQQTVLFQMSANGLPDFVGFSDKHDRDFVQESYTAAANQAEDTMNAALLEALKESVAPFEPARYSYEAFEREYGKEIWGGKQPKRALNALRPALTQAGILLELKVLRLDGKPRNGFILKMIEKA